MENFKSIKQKVVTAETVINKSRFLAFACGVSDAAQANSFIAGIAKKHYAATHNCYAYRLTDGQKFSDDGEPQGTAGMPILECIKSKGLTNVVVVVTRYFGGVKLGAGGLVRAYTEATAAALDLAEKTEFKLCVKVEFTADYRQTNLLNSLLDKRARKVETAYEGDVKFNVLIEKSMYAQFEADFTELTQGQIELVLNGEVLEECEI